MTLEQNVITNHFLECWRVNRKGAAATSSESEHLPTELNTLNSSGGFSIVGPDKLSVRYPNSNMHDHDVGVVQANKPAPPQCLIYYFEITVKSSGAKGQMSIGFTGPGFKMRRQPGWEANSCGYHGDDGLLYRGHGKGEKFGPTYTEGDTVGGGINFDTQEFFFTKNGSLIGKTYKDENSPLYPTVAVHSQNEEVTVNFGKDPFVFNIKDFEAQERRKQQAKIDELVIPQDASHIIVRSYLQHYGYEETLNLFVMAAENSAPPIDVSSQDLGHGESMYDISRRKIMREVIRNGNIDDAIAKLHEWYPTILKDETAPICFLLCCQKFIELVREKKPEEAMWHGQKEFGKFRDLAETDDLVKDCASLLAYVNLLECSAGYLLADSQRENLADAVNAVILSTNPNKKDLGCCFFTHLEKLLRQLSACYALRRCFNGDQGEDFKMCRFFETSSGE